MMSRHLAISAAMNVASSSGVKTRASAPCSVKRSRTAGPLSAALSFWWRWATVGLGVPLRAADADRAVVELSRPLLGVGDQLGQRLHRELRARDDHDRKRGDHRDRLEVLLRVVAEIAIERLVGGDRSGARSHQGIPV